MNKLEMREIKASRNNLTGFLHFSKIAELNSIFENFDVNKKNFNNICDEALRLKECKELSHKKVSAIFKILEEENRSYRKESHRIDACNSIFEYIESDNIYVFLKKGTQREFNMLNHYL